MISNIAELLSHGETRLREDALKILERGIRGADPGVGTRRLIRMDGEVLRIGKKVLNLNTIENIFVVGVGKASFPIAAVLEETLGERIKKGIVVVKRGEKRRLSRIEIHEAGHPLPDKQSISGAKKILEIVREAGPNDLVFAAVTGGASALATIPPKEITLQDVQALTDMLLKCGAAIREINAVRKHLCLLKGGRLVAYIQPAEAVTLTLDTAPEGMPWPDMCLADPSTFQDAINVLRRYGLWRKVHERIRNYLQEGLDRPEMETVKSLKGMKADIFSVGDPSKACEAAAGCAEELGYTPVILSTYIEGEAREIGVCLAGIAKEIIKRQRPFAPPCVIISGGETVVTMSGQSGLGGPNQETVLAFAAKFSMGQQVVFVSIDTDGTDGPTDVAGGIVDWSTVPRSVELGIEIDQSLKSHNSLDALKKLGDAVITGHTGTNVMNLRLIVIR